MSDPALQPRPGWHGQGRAGPDWPQPAPLPAERTGKWRRLRAGPKWRRWRPGTAALRRAPGLAETLPPAAVHLRLHGAAGRHLGAGVRKWGEAGRAPTARGSGRGGRCGFCVKLLHLGVCNKGPPAGTRLKCPVSPLSGYGWGILSLWLLFASFRYFLSSEGAEVARGFEWVLKCVTLPGSGFASKSRTRLPSITVTLRFTTVPVWEELFLHFLLFFPPFPFEISLFLSVYSGTVKRVTLQVFGSHYLCAFICYCSDPPGHCK